MALSHNTLDLSDSTEANLKKIARAAWEQSQRDGRTPDEAIAFVLEVALYNGLLDDELTENILISLGRTFDMRPVNIQSDFNKNGDDEEDSLAGED